MRAVWMVLGLVACGISADTPVQELDSDDWAKLCEDLVADFPAEETITPCDGYDAVLPPYDFETCVSDAEFYSVPCDAVVGDWETCIRGVVTRDPCSGEEPSACELLAQCTPLGG